MDVKYLLIFSFFLEIQSVEEQSSQFEDVKKQLEDVKKQFEDVKKQLEDTKLQLEDTKLKLEDNKLKLDDKKILFEDTKLQLDDKEIQFEKTKTLLENSKAEISVLGKKLAEIYSKDPCKNCKGPTVCLDGQFLRNTPGHGTMIRAVKDTSYFNKNGTQVKVGADDFGTVDTVKLGRPLVQWNTKGNLYCDDFTGFVYKCK